MPTGESIALWAALAGLAALMWDRRGRGQDGTGGLSVTGGSVSIDASNPVENRTVFQFLGWSYNGITQGTIGLGGKWGLEPQTGRQAPQWGWIFDVVVRPGDYVSHVPDVSMMSPGPGTDFRRLGSYFQELASNESKTWWVPRTVSLGEAQALSVIEIPEQYRFKPTTP
jgi:hypothetical protein